MTQTRSRRRAPLSLGLIVDVANAIAEFAAAPPIECRLHPDDWDEVRRRLPHGALPTTPGAASLCADMGIGSPSGCFTEIRIVLDVDASRLPRKGGAS